MASLRRLFFRLLNATRPRRGELGLDRELAAHLRLLEDDFQRRGLSVEQARLAAKRAIGGVEHLRLFGVQPTAGRWFDTEELKPGPPTAAIVSAAFAQSHFGGSHEAIGRTIRLADRSCVIVGVAPADFAFPERTEIWAPLPLPDVANPLRRGGENFRAVARLKSGVSLERAQSEMTTIAGRLEQQYPDTLVVDATVATPDPRQPATLFFRDLLAAISKVPGVVAAGATMAAPGRVDSTGAYWIDHVPQPSEMRTGSSNVNSIVAPGTFTALGILLVRGRDFDDRDVRDAPMTAVVNESLARRALPGQDIIGHTLSAPSIRWSR